MALPYLEGLSKVDECTLRQTGKSTLTTLNMRWCEYKIQKAYWKAKQMSMKFSHLHR